MSTWSSQVSLTALWQLRNKRHARRFRTWLRTADMSDDMELARLYVEALGRGLFDQYTC